MASSSSSSIHKVFRYDVYLSVRGEDTCKNFVDHLYAAFQQKGINTFKDDKRIEKGSMIGDEVLRSIEESKFFIIVFSKNYASSSWCLEELVKIMECQKTAEQTVYPVYYGVEPYEVRRQIGAFGEAFAKHSNNEAAGRWREALKEAADLAGWDLRNTDDGHEAKDIQNIVEEISLELRSINFSYDEKLVGLEPQVKEVLSSLVTGFEDVRMIGIKGMGGVGKTTLARVIFDKVSFLFEGRSFVENVREISNASLSSLKSLQTQILTDVLNDGDMTTVSSVYDGKDMMKRRLGGRKVLVVLDDVDHLDQLEALAGSPNWFGKGSIIIITTRDEQPLLQHGVQQIHHVDVLSDEEAMCLFSRYAFGKEIPVQEYEQLSLQVVLYAAGLPLTIKVLGSFLCGKSKLEWMDVLERLKLTPLKETLENFNISYISMEDDYKEIFLNVACFMTGMRDNEAIRILESCGFHARVGLRYLVQKSLLTISNECLGMHNHIEEIGRYIVRSSHPHQPNRHSRLWIREEIEYILANNLGTEAMRCIQLLGLQLSPNIVMNGFKSMKELRCLIVESVIGSDDLSCDSEFDEISQSFPKSLQFLRWVHYPFRSLPEKFQANNLVALEMPGSRIVQMWEGEEKKVLHNLRFLDLSYSMLTALDLGLTPQLEWLELKECRALVELYTPAESLKRLAHLDLIGCLMLESSSIIKRLEMLKLLSLPKLEVVAESLEEFPRCSHRNQPKLAFMCIYCEEQASSIENAQRSVALSLQPRTKLESVSGSIHGLQHLRHLTINGCIPSVPKDLDQLTYLETLKLVSTHITSLPDSLCKLKHLKSLKLKYCMLLEELPKDLGLLECLEKLSLLSARITLLPDSICMLKQLKSLKVKSCSLLMEVPEELGQLQCLEKLDLLSAHIRRLPDGICMLGNLKSLELESCALLERLPEGLGLLKSLRELNVKGAGISYLPQSISLVKGLRVVGSEAVLQSCAFTSEIETSETGTFCYIRAVINEDTGRLQSIDYSIRHLSTPSMASSSSSSIRKVFMYDVYLSFRGVDTRRNFVNRLYDAFQQKGIYTYKDDKRIKKGSMIGNELIKSVEESKFLIIIFSKNYAASVWCLEELVRIMRCYKTAGQTVCPVYYGVEPYEVRKQIGPVGEAFAENSKKESAGRWKWALQEAASLPGWDLRNTADGDEVKGIQRIVEDISLKLRSINFSYDEKLVGMERRIEEVVSSLKIGHSDVQMMGIKGMGGVGKTTLARAIFDKVSLRFEGKSFVENVREVSKVSLSGLKSLQARVLSDVLNDGDIIVSSVYAGKNMIKRRMDGKRVLIVLDDVDRIDQLEALAGAPNWFGKGSIIIITTRDEQPLLQHGVQQIHHVDVLSDEEAIHLFSRYAFGKEIPVQGYEQQSLQVVHYAAGLPLTIKVLGSFLRGKSKLEWMDVLERLETIPLKETVKKLELSYSSLEEDHKEIFLDVACFMKGLRKDDAIRILESCDFHARNGLRVLQQKSLLTISNERLDMHDHIQEMGRNIVRRTHPDRPNKHSRLWIREEIENILADDLGTKATTCVGLPDLQLGPNIVMKGFGRMENLRCLIVESETDNDDLSWDWKFDEVGQYFPNALQFLRWVDYPVRFLPETFRADNLVALEMPCSRITQLWEGGERKVLWKLRFIDLSYSKLETLDLGLIPNIERLELRECRDLVELNTPVGSLKRLVHLNLVGCSRFKSFSYIKHVESLGVLSLSRLHLIAKSLQHFPRYSNDNLPKLGFTCLYSEELNSWNKNDEKFVSLNLQPCTKLESVSGSICGLHHLRHLTVNGCIPEVPTDLDQLQCLEKLSFLSTHIKRLPDSLCMLKHLKSLKLKSCLLLEELPKDLGQLVCLEKLTLLSTRITHLPESICMLKHLKSLKIKSCKLLETVPEDLGQLECLEKLNLLSARIEHLPDSICMLKTLKSLELKSCGFLQKLPKDLGQMECLEKLVLSECMSLKEIPNSICEMTNLKCFYLPYCVRVKELPAELGRLECLRELIVEGTGISHLPQSMSVLKDVRVVGSVALLQSCGFASEVQTLEGETFCYIQPSDRE